LSSLCQDSLSPNIRNHDFTREYILDSRSQVLSKLLMDSRKTFKNETNALKFAENYNFTIPHELNLDVLTKWGGKKVRSSYIYNPVKFHLSAPFFRGRRPIPRKGQSREIMNE